MSNSEERSSNELSEPHIITVQHIEIFDDPHCWKGYKITMNDTTKNITCKISNEQDCCEVYGAHISTINLRDMSRDSPKRGQLLRDSSGASPFFRSDTIGSSFHCTNTSLDDFIGAQYHSVNITKDVKDQLEEGGDISTRVDIMILTDRGQITIQLYNEHNGYYQHDFFIETEHGMTQEYL